MGNVGGTLVLLVLVGAPFLLTAWNLFTFLRYLVKKMEKSRDKVVEAAAMCIGMLYVLVYTDLSEIMFATWDKQLYNSQLHSFVAPDALATVVVWVLVALAGYGVIRFVPADKQSPVVSAAGISAVYIGIGLCVLLCVQTASRFFLVLLPANCILIFIKSIAVLVVRKNDLLQQGIASTKFKTLSGLLNRATNLPWISLLLVIPLLGVLVGVLALFGQAPSSIIQAWTETADWTMSQRIPPQNIQVDQHYLCTVAAGGHRAVVKPIRTGMRHGHRVVVNRQLCIANAFEQVLEERVPLLHRWMRTSYDAAGYPISKHIRSTYVADAIYFLMKPLEWVFLLVLYTVEANPEDRIAVQYPHSALRDFAG